MTVTVDRVARTGLCPVCRCHYRVVVKVPQGAADRLLDRFAADHQGCRMTRSRQPVMTTTACGGYPKDGAVVVTIKTRKD